ncbi:Oleuropein beta-glucosidase [Sesamum alatum]|uniref:Oleuropein beta-glucosidase n=1 Tax=Sesamum alatum TaxID=300844 RepID=A0AAE1YLS9_9LAMI|nr:Oleuropein beta-glucosidase [Sesamum alatum]
MDSQNSLVLISNNVDIPPVVSDHQVARYNAAKLTRRDFDKDFVFGSATSAYQVEGAYAEDGKSLSNWDVFSIRTPGQIADGSNGCVAIDQYHLYKDDIQTMKKVGGRLSAGINTKGIKYYSDLIDALLAEGIEPYVTLFHWDIPQCLEEEYGGFLSTRVVKDFIEFAEVCFWEFGDRVKYWITLNEPWTYTNHGYVEGIFPPLHGSVAPKQNRTHTLQYRSSARSRELQRGLVPKGDPATDPYNVGHNMILVHAATVDLYRKQFQGSQGGKIGITNVSKWFEPLNDNQDDKDAASRAVDFMLGWFVAPIVTGDYPPIMRELVGDRLPKFSADEEKLVKGSFDFLGMNYYTTNYASYAPNPPGTPPSYYADQLVAFSTERDGIPIGPKGGSDWMYVVPFGIHRLLVHIKKTYNDPLIYITEHGVDEINDKSKTVAEEGYSVRFGIFYIDFENGNLTRYPKSSAIWWKSFLAPPKLLGATKRQVEETRDVFDVSVKRLKSGQGYK